MRINIRCCIAISIFMIRCYIVYADFLQASEPSPRLRSRLTEVRAKAEKLLTPEQYNEALGKAKRIAEWNLTLKRRVGETMAGHPQAHHPVTSQASLRI